jgi:hypothetical protein
MNKLIPILQTIIGDGAAIATVFIHNPVSQQIEAIVIASIDAALGMVQSLTGATPPTTPPTPPPASS